MRTFTSLKSVRRPGYACRKHVTAREHRKKTNGTTKGVHGPATGTSAAKNSRPYEYQKTECPEAEGCVVGQRDQPETRKVVISRWI